LTGTPKSITKLDVKEIRGKKKERGFDQMTLSWKGEGVFSYPIRLNKWRTQQGGTAEGEGVGTEGRVVETISGGGKTL